MKIRIIFFLAVLPWILIFSQSITKEDVDVEYLGDAKIEAGSYYAGLEFHHSYPVPQRISFYYPAANSIDLSTDYWKRDTSVIMALGLKIGDNRKDFIKPQSYEFVSTPWSVSFNKKDKEKGITITYNFCKDKPAFVITYEIENLTGRTEDFEFYTHLPASIKTSHTFKLKNSAWTEFKAVGSSLITNFDDRETQNSSVFICNAGLLPASWSTSGKEPPYSQNDEWLNNRMGNVLISRNAPSAPALKYVYKKRLEPSQKLTVIQVIGSCRNTEPEELISYLINNYLQEISNYEEFILSRINENVFRTGDTAIDHSVYWANGILESSKHYINGSIQPMPCPAEYNFYFTHDVLLTDLAGVYFDPERVRKDLRFIKSLTRGDSVIPHAYYWKDSVYQTEFTTPDNWNHFWFIIASASYLRHSLDTALLKELYPLINKSLKEVLLNKKEDNLVWAYRPDWWDIGRNFGPRTYMTLQLVKALRDYIYISVMLRKDLNMLRKYEAMANDIEKQLNKVLWKDDYGYLMNYFEDGKLDKHFYIGSLLAAHYNLLSKERKETLLNTAAEKLLDKKLGIYVVYPMDFHKLIEYLRFAGNEAGDPFFYANGGIWPHGNAWYALALISAGRKEEAFSFIKSIMTIDGILNSPNGQPGMYEYRNGNYNDPYIYGTMDKPQFMWAAGWYIYCLYHLYGTKENEWNISFAPYLPGSSKTEFVLNANGNLLNVNISGEGEYIRSISTKGGELNSAVISKEMSGQVNIIMGKPEEPLLTETNCLLKSCFYNDLKKSLNISINSFPGHESKLKIISPTAPKTVLINNQELKKGITINEADNLYICEINFITDYEADILEINY